MNIMNSIKRRVIAKFVVCRYHTEIKNTALNAC